MPPPEPLLIVVGVLIQDVTPYRATVGARVRLLGLADDPVAILDLRRHASDEGELARWREAEARGARVRVTVEIEPEPDPP